MANNTNGQPIDNPTKTRRKNDNRLFKPKGRIVDNDALIRIKTIIGDAPYQRDLLIEYLHMIQDEQGCLSAADLSALASLLQLAQTEVYEVASFYHHFDVVKENETEPAPVNVRVCDSLSCMLNGCETLIAELQQQTDSKNIRITRVPCIGLCDKAPAATIVYRKERRIVPQATVTAVTEAISNNEITTAPPPYQPLVVYKKNGGYELLRQLVNGDRTPQQLIDNLTDAGLRGLGGAGFPAGRKWSIVRSYPGPRLMTINGDEGEPGTFKDRYYLGTSPHKVLEGALIAAFAVEADRCYFYLRDEYPDILQILKSEIAKLDAEGLTKHCPIEIRRGAGAYICGEESAMIESIEGKRGLPRNRPPYIAEKGLFGRPTLNHNVETLYWITDIINHNADWFADSNGGRGPRSYSVSGRVKSPGVKIAPAGISVQQLIDDYCGGMADGHKFIGYLPGGASGGILPATMADLSLDFGQLEKYGCLIGSHAIVILSDHDDIKQVAANLMRFFAHESCGQCTPCRLGTVKMLELIEQNSWDENLIGDLEQVMREASICGLGQAAANPVRCVLEYFT